MAGTISPTLISPIAELRRAAIRARPPDADPVRAVRGALRAVLGKLSADELANMRQRAGPRAFGPGPPYRGDPPLM